MANDEVVKIKFPITRQATEASLGHQVEEVQSTIPNNAPPLFPGQTSRSSDCTRSALKNGDDDGDEEATVARTRELVSHRVVSVDWICK